MEAPVDRHLGGKREFNFYNLFMVLAMSFGSMGYGYGASIIATTLAQPTFIKHFELDTRSDATSLISTMNGLYQVGGLLAVFSISWFADTWGRKAAISASAVITLLSGALLAGSVNIAMFIVFRFTSGAGAFMILSAVPIWMNEVVPPKNRGMLVDLHGAALLFGYALATWIGYGFYFYTAESSNTWRAPLAFQCLPVAILLAMMPWLPESPRYLLMKDRFEEAEATLNKLHAPEEAAIELVQIRNQMQIDRVLPTSYWAMFARPSYRKRSFLALGTTCSIQFSGILVINNYGPTIYAGLGYSTERQLLLQGGWITLAFGAGVLALFVVDRLPRPKLIAIGIAGCMAALIIEAALVANFAAAATNVPALKAAVAMIFVYVVFYEVALDGTQFAYLGELFPTHIRAKGMNLGVAGICLMNIIWLQVAPTAFINIGWKFYLCFIIPGCISAVIIWLYFPDTWGVPLEEVAAMFGDANELYRASVGSGEADMDLERNSKEKQEVQHAEVAA
ncbi:hypothetical protein B0A49_01803 [Cryomyces minteri]|uniref:Major facilitator superfamily (MFS) profile domain-containing protein n=1 Tax=Cryomyces minteri TaxID=331657 RepID=A0A4U0XK06_9PEZI|nr:hypothetical protein B0A49_01803 [Cryomyces minteri]